MFVTLTKENMRSVLMSVILTFTLILSMVGVTIPAHAASADALELWNAVKADYQQVDYISAMKATNPRWRFLDQNEARVQLRKELGTEPTAEQVQARVEDLYGQQLNLGQAYEVVLQQADELLPRVIDQAIQYDLVDADYLRNNKTQILLGLAYLRHYYSFDIGGKPAWEHMLLEGSTSLLDRIRALGASRFEMLQGQTSARQYAAVLAPYTGQASITDYITNALATHQAGTPASQWLPTATKALVTDKGKTTLFDRFANDAQLRDQLLPLLALSGQHLYALNTDYTVQYGLTSSYEGSAPDLATMIDRAATEQQAFWEFWKRTSTTMDRMGELPTVVVYDTLQRQPASGNLVSQRWSPKWGPGTDPGVREFLTPMNKHIPYLQGASAQASGTDLRYFGQLALTQSGTNTYTHELTHVYEDRVWFNGLPVREGVGPEAYARGLFESENNTPGLTEYKPMFNLNTAYELDDNRLQNQSPERFQTPADIKEYMRGLMDVIYSLDAMEALSALKLDPAGKAAAFNKASLQPIADNGAPAGYKGDSFAPVTEAEMANVNTLNDVIDAGLSSGRLIPKGNTAHQTIRYNEYVTAPLFEPVYAGLQSDTAATGGLTFRRNAHELLAEYGWEEGFLPYISGKYANDAEALAAIMPEHGGNLTTFKKAMFERRVNKFDQMKPVAGFANAQEMQAAMDRAVAQDVALIQAGNYPDLLQGLAGGGHAVRELKQRIFQAYLLSTNDFRSSIYQDPQPTEERETRTEEIPVEEEIILDDTVLAGTPDEVVNPGQAGERELTYVYTLVNGQRQGEGRLENTRVTREMVKRQIRRGTKAMPLTPANVNAVDYTLPADKVKITVTDNGTEKPLSEAGDVKFRFTVKETPVGGSVTGVPEAPVAPQPNGELPAMDPWKFTGAGTYVIEVTQVPGAVEGMTYDTTPRTLTVVTDWETVPGSTARRLAVKSVTFTKDGETVTEMVLSNTVDLPAPVVTYQDTVVTREIPVEDEVIDDPTLTVGTEVVTRQGHAGERKITSRQRYIDGVADGDPEVTETVTVPMETRQIRRGTKALVLTPGIVKPVQPAVKHIPQADVPRPESPCDPRLATRTWKVPADSDSMKWAVSPDGELVVTAAEGYIFDLEDGTTSQTINFGLPNGSEMCSIQIPVPPVPQVTDPCGAGNATWILPANTDKLVWILEDGHAVVQPAVGYHFPGEVVAHDFGLAPEKNTAACGSPDPGQGGNTNPGQGGNADPAQGGNTADQEQHKVGSGQTITLPIYPLWPGLLGGFTPSWPSTQPAVPPTQQPHVQAPLAQNPQVQAPQQPSMPATKATVAGNGLASTGASSGMLAAAGVALGLGLLLRRRS